MTNHLAFGIVALILPLPFIQTSGLFPMIMAVYYPAVLFLLSTYVGLASSTKEHGNKTSQEDDTSITVCSSETEDIAEKIEELKLTLKSLLTKHHGSTKHPDVINIVNELAELNPFKNKSATVAQFSGDFISKTSPNYPGRLKTEKGMENIVQYTLGRLSFNLFQPTKLVCTLGSTHNIVLKKEEKTQDGKPLFSYDNISDILIHTPEGDVLPATLAVEGTCCESSRFKDRLDVTFHGSTLTPTDEVKTNAIMLELWAKTFEGAYKKADEERSYSGWAVQLFFKAMLGLSLPNDNGHSFHFGMKRPPKFHLDVLYLDDSLRITKGSRGTIVIVERTAN